METAPARVFATCEGFSGDVFGDRVSRLQIIVVPVFAESENNAIRPEFRASLLGINSNPPQHGYGNLISSHVTHRDSSLRRNAGPPLLNIGTINPEMRLYVATFS